MVADPCAVDQPPASDTAYTTSAAFTFLRLRKVESVRRRSYVFATLVHMNVRNTVSETFNIVIHTKFQMDRGFGMLTTLRLV